MRYVIVTYPFGVETLQRLARAILVWCERQARRQELPEYLQPPPPSAASAQRHV